MNRYEFWTSISYLSVEASSLHTALTKLGRWIEVNKTRGFSPISIKLIGVYKIPKKEGEQK